MSWLFGNRGLAERLSRGVGGIVCTGKRVLAVVQHDRRVLLDLNYEQYAECLAQFFQITPRAGEMLAVDGKCGW
jgi:hypothetical protein